MLARKKNIPKVIKRMVYVDSNYYFLLNLASCAISKFLQLVSSNWRLWLLYYLVCSFQWLAYTLLRKVHFKICSIIVFMYSITKIQSRVCQKYCYISLRNTALNCKGANSNFNIFEIKGLLSLTAPNIQHLHPLCDVSNNQYIYIEIALSWI